MSGFGQVAGHERIVEQIQKSIEKNRVSHAYLFSGEEGCGKFLLAKLFAQALNCEQKASNPCGLCKSCKQFQSKNHPDVVTIVHEKSGSISIEEIRKQIGDTIQIRPYNGKYKIYLLPNAERMTVQAQNALLKALEEPPAYVVMFLLAERKEALLPTIRSRCVQINVGSVREEVIQEYLTGKLQIAEEQARVLAAFSQGNLGKGISLAKSEHFCEWCRNMAFLLGNRKKISRVQFLEEYRKQEKEQQEFERYLEWLTVWYRDCLIYKATGEERRLIFQEFVQTIRQMAKEMSYEAIGRVLEELETGKERWKANGNVELIIELLWLTIKEN